ncbi:DUF429 domain-containing protein [Pseudorhodoferax sp. Leaf267]|uniref:DUF429 domain-containing protein n=1 Tax=Pseudorhodoferax sp. Leaf267 TaxID=1736316 RepID=UPI0006F4D4C6|nr:DUF429 domain-containing protein [Pseudorhodoferax sp. Leaf267]KQP13285.1 hypothetical protein ASF43_19515 [Pseudorhodoferax sp. Leaf267]
MTAPGLLLGCDFSSAPNRRKPVVLALGALHGERVVLQRLERLETLPAFGRWLAQPGEWLGVFDLPFGLPRELVLAQGWPTDWEACMRHYASLDREELRARFVAFCAARPAGGKFAHRATDGPAGSSPSMKWVNPPVAWMLHAGVPLLLEAGVYLPGLSPDAHADRTRVALEGYPGLLAREALGGRRSYKSDARPGQTPERLIARKDLLAALESGIGPLGPLRLGLRLKLTHAQHDALVADASGDLLDAVLCLLQAGWAQRQHEEGAPRYGLPAGMDGLEGWIVTAPWPGG